MLKVLKHIGLILTLSFPIFSYADSSFSKMYVFGDSLSDTGNLAAIELGKQFGLPGPLSPLPEGTNFRPPYFDFRFTNGPVAVDVLAELLDSGLDARAYFDFDILKGELPGSNYAVAGARARNSHGEEEPIDLGDQVSLFIKTHAVFGGAPSDALYVIMIGGNDVRDARDALKIENYHRATEIIDAAVDAITKNLNILQSQGAKVFFVANAPNITLSPESFASPNRRYKHDALKLTKRFNEKLRHAIRHFEKENEIQVPIFNLFAFGRMLNRNNVSFGLSNRNTACYTNLSPLVGYSGDGCSNEIGGVIRNYAFFDEIHPSSFVHNRIGRAMYSLVPTFK